MVYVTRNDKGEPTGGAVAWRMRSGAGRWMLTDDGNLAEELRALGWEVQPLGVIPDGVPACEGCKLRPLCRDCADNDGTCPNDGLPCDPKARHTCGKYATPGRSNG